MSWRREKNICGDPEPAKKPKIQELGMARVARGAAAYDIHCRGVVLSGLFCERGADV